MGKLTVARHLASCLRGGYDVKVVQNHLLIDPIEAICSRDDPAYQQLRRELRQVILRAVPSFPDTMFIFTDFQSDNTLGRSVCAEYREAARFRSSAFIPITLTCAVEENVRRAVSAERSVVSTNKLTDENLVADICKRCTPYTPDVPEKLVIDTTSMEPDNVAARIAAHINGLLPFSHVSESAGKFVAHKSQLSLLWS